MSIMAFPPYGTWGKRDVILAGMRLERIRDGIYQLSNYPDEPSITATGSFDEIVEALKVAIVTNRMEK